MKKQPKALFLDWNKTLSNSLFWSQLADKEHDYNSYHEPIIKWLFKDNSHLINEWMRGDKTSRDICRMISEKNNLDEAVVYGELAKSCKKMEFCSPRIKDLIVKIKQKGIKVIIATDNMDTFQKFTVTGMRLNTLFDDFLISYEKKVLKYDTKDKEIPFFDSFLKKNNWSYEDVVLIDDSEDKTGVYKKLGFEIKLVNEKNNLLKHLKKFAK